MLYIQLLWVERIFLRLINQLTKHQTCKLAICENRRLRSQSYQVQSSHYRSTIISKRITLGTKKAILTLLQLQDQLFVSFFRCSSSNISFNLTHRIKYNQRSRKIRMTPLFSSLRYHLYVCQMKCPDRSDAYFTRRVRTAVHRLLICYPHKKVFRAHQYREEKSLRHVAMVAKCFDDNKPIKSLKKLFALFQTLPILFIFI